jgi:hypothetical protein
MSLADLDGGSFYDNHSGERYTRVVHNYLPVSNQAMRSLRIEVLYATSANH